MMRPQATIGELIWFKREDAQARWEKCLAKNGTGSQEEKDRAWRELHGLLDTVGFLSECLDRSRRFRYKGTKCLPQPIAT